MIFTSRSTELALAVKASYCLDFRFRVQISFIQGDWSLVEPEASGRGPCVPAAGASVPVYTARAK
jgi:hypothetical protein